MLNLIVWGMLAVSLILIRVVCISIETLMFLLVARANDKLFYTQPIINFDLAFESSKQNTPSGLINRVISIKLWVYDAKTLELIKGSPFYSKSQASKSIGINRKVIDYFIDTFKAEGVKGTYLFTRPLENKEINNLIIA